MKTATAPATCWAACTNTSSVSSPAPKKSATLEDIRKHGHVLTPGRYVGAAAQEDDGEPFDEKMTRLAAQWREQRAEAARLDAAIETNLDSLGFEEEVT